MTARGGRSPYTGWALSLHGGNGFPTRSKRFPYTGQSACAEATADKKGFPARVRRGNKKPAYAKGDGAVNKKPAYAKGYGAVNKKGK